MSKAGRLAERALAALALCACREPPPEASRERPAGTNAAAPAPPSATPAAPRPAAGETLDIPAGRFTAGSNPGDVERAPALEPAEVEVALGGFRIDRLPFPNDPATPPLRGLTRDAAAARCAERGARLCTELEWERACRGPSSAPYSTGADWDATCAASGCAGSSGLAGLGTLREWTASDTAAGDAAPQAVLRGAPEESPPRARRCARRRAAGREAAALADVAFRCCHGPRNAAVVREPTAGRLFEPTPLTAEAIASILASDPRTAPLAAGVRLFPADDAPDTVVQRGPGDRKGFLFTALPLRYRPATGVDVLLLTARSGDSSLVAAFHVLGAGRHRLAASFVMQSEPGPVVFAYSPSIRPRLHFSSCWGCPGETGKILFREPEDIAILQP